jgi:hypothetical protein
MITTRSAVLCGSRARCNTAHMVAREQARAVPPKARATGCARPKRREIDLLSAGARCAGGQTSGGVLGGDDVTAVIGHPRHHDQPHRHHGHEGADAAGLARIGGEAHRSPPRYRANDPVRRQALAGSHQHPVAQTQFAWAYGGLDAVPHHGTARLGAGKGSSCFTALRLSDRSRRQLDVGALGPSSVSTADRTPPRE